MERSRSNRWLIPKRIKRNSSTGSDLALDAKRMTEALHLRRYVLAGHSMGGKVAQFIASQRPEGLEALVLVAPATPTPQNLPEPAKQAQLHAYHNRKNALQAIAFLTAFPPSDALREQILSDNFASAPRARLAWPTSSAYEYTSSLVGIIAVPTLILAGDQDRQDPLEQHEREVLPRISGAEIKVIRNSGHLIPSPHACGDLINAGARGFKYLACARDLQPLLIFAWLSARALREAAKSDVPQ